MQQERDKLSKAVQRVANLKPNLLLVEKTVARVVQEVRFTTLLA
jgi:hypothetical protein